MSSHFSNLKANDPKLAQLIEQETQRQKETLMMIPSENMASTAVQEAVGSCLGNKYAEGYPGARYYQGQEFVDQIENLVIERAKKVFQVPHANVQPLSGSPANLAVYLGLLKPGETLMGLDLTHGGHLTHGSNASVSSLYYQSVAYQLGRNGVMDYEAIEKLALKHQPKLIIAGITAYPLQLDWARFAKITDQVGAYLMADIAHLAGLVAAEAYPSPVPYVDVVTTTTHKTLRGPRGAIIMATAKGLKKDETLDKKIDRAVFPRLQGGPHLNTIAGIGVALKEAMTPDFKKYGQQIVKNAQVLATTLKQNDFKLVAGGTESHLLLIDLSNKKISGNLAAEALEAANIILNRNSIPFDQSSPFYPSGIRLGTPGLTSRKMKEVEMKKIATWIAAVIKDVATIKNEQNVTAEQEKKQAVRQQIIAASKQVTQVKQKVLTICEQFPVPTSVKE